jgi:hypothetical protein
MLNPSPCPSRTLDWSGFKAGSSSPSITKFHLAIASSGDSRGCFNPRSIAILLRYVAECHKIRKLSLHHVNVQLQDVVKLSSALKYLQDLEISVPFTVGSRRESYGWKKFKLFLSGCSELKNVYFLESDTLSFRHILTGTRVQRKMESDKVFTFDEAMQWSAGDFLKHSSNIRRFWKKRRGLHLIFRNL